MKQPARFVVFAWLLGLAKPRAGFVLGALVIFLCTFTVFFFGVGK
jgi:hypothetical protein